LDLIDNYAAVYDPDETAGERAGAVYLMAGREGEEPYGHNGCFAGAGGEVNEVWNFAGEEVVEEELLPRER